MKKIHLIYPILLLLSESSIAIENNAAIPIVQKYHAQNNGFGDFSGNLTMTLRNSAQEESKRMLRIRTVEVPGEGDKSMIVFDKPSDVRGTALLTHSHKTDNNDQWLYLPSLKRVKRISTSNQSGPFLGSEFAFEDLSSEEMEKYNYKFLTEENCGDSVCYTYEQHPINKNSGYTRQIVTMDKFKMRPVSVQYYDRKDALLKTLTYSNYQLYLDKYWRSHQMDMVNHQTEKSTTLLWEDVVYQAGLEERAFSKQGLKRIR